MEMVIIIDLDDTLLKSDKTISDYSINTLKKCKSMGMEIIYSTARSIQASQNLFKRFMPDIFVGYGGSLAIANEKTILRFDISQKISREIINKCLETPEVIGIYAANEQIALYNGLDLGSSYYKYNDFSYDYDYSYLKISMHVNDLRVVKSFSDRFPMCNIVKYRNENIYGFSNCNVTK